MHQQHHLIIAIDGPSGSGKSTIAQQIAAKLKLIYIDTGAMFRAIGLFLLEQNFLEKNDHQLNFLISDNQLKTTLTTLDFQYGVNAQTLVTINGKDFTNLIRAHEVSALASFVAKNNVIRAYLKSIQQKIGESNSCVMDGRDIGTVIFPQATIKIFLTASSHARAQRRYLQLEKLNQIKNLDLETIEQDIIARDLQDSQRNHAPMIQADDAVLIDSSLMSLDEVVNSILNLYDKKYSKKIE